MVKLSRCIMWMALLAIGLLAILSVFGTFCGAEKAKAFFNSAPLAAYWYVLALLLLAGLVEFPTLVSKHGLLMVHLGCLFVLAGSMWGSGVAHRLAARFLGTNKVPSGYMRIYEGDSENTIVTEELRPIAQLPFSIKLEDFRIEYYEPDEDVRQQLFVQTSDGRNFQITAEPGNVISLGEANGKLKVVRTFKNFKIRIEGEQKVVTDEEGAGENPAVEVEIERPDGTKHTHYVFEYFSGHSVTEDGLRLSYFSEGQRLIRDYFSDLVVIKDGKEVLRKTIEVNHPLHYGGYHFYQYSYDSEAGKYTVLSVTSDSGLYIVYTGYLLLCLGVLWRFWFRHIFGYFKRKRQALV